MTTRSYILDELGDPDAPIGSRLWSLWVANEIRKALYDKQQTGEKLRSLVEMFKEQQAWQELGFLTWEDFCERKLQQRPGNIENEVARRASEAKALNSNGGDRYQSNNYNTDTPSMQGTNADYLTARIARDAPDILERMKAGEYRSVRAAAIDAGIVKERKRLAFYSDDPQAAGKYLAQRVDREWFEQLIDAYYKHIEDDQ